MDPKKIVAIALILLTSEATQLLVWKRAGKSYAFALASSMHKWGLMTLSFLATKQFLARYSSFAEATSSNRYPSPTAAFAIVCAALFSAYFHVFTDVPGIARWHHSLSELIQRYRGSRESAGLESTLWTAHLDRLVSLLTSMGGITLAVGHAQYLEQFGVGIAGTVGFCVSTFAYGFALHFVGSREAGGDAVGEKVGM